MHFTKATIGIKVHENKLKMTVEDNGVGFATGMHSPRGNGLNNMQKRAEESGAALDLTSTEGKGTCIRFVASV